ncbi:MAG TPA: 30S ribosomal protein S20 [Polyangiaceae bacterium]
MANHPSAEKRNRQRVVRTERNRALKSSLRTAVKKARSAVHAGDGSKAQPLVLLAERALARAASKGVLTKKTAARVTSRIAKSVAKIAKKK